MHAEAPRVSKPIIDLFPLSPRACMAYIPEFNNLRAKGYHYQDIVQYSDVQIAGKMEIENPNLYESIEQHAEQMAPDYALTYRRGSQIAYRVFSSQAALDRGVPALVTVDNIERYERDTYGDEWFELIASKDADGKIKEADRLENERFMNQRAHLLYKLEAAEPIFISMVRSNTKSLGKYRLETLEDGIIDTYFPFKVRQEARKLRKLVRK